MGGEVSRGRSLTLQCRWGRWRGVEHRKKREPKKQHSDTLATYDGEPTRGIHLFEHRQRQLPEQFQPSAEGGHGIVQPAPAKLQLRAVQQHDRRLLIVL